MNVCVAGEVFDQVVSPDTVSLVRRIGYSMDDVENLGPNHRNLDYLIFAKE
jgi:hypothetical protein